MMSEKIYECTGQQHQLHVAIGCRAKMTTRIASKQMRLVPCSVSLLVC